MRGFAITLVAVSMIAILLILSVSLRGSYLSMERALTEPQPLLYASFMFDTVANDVRSIVGPNMTFYPANDSFGIRFVDTVPSRNFSSGLAAYESFLEGTMANETHASIDVNLSMLTPEDSAVVINDDYTYSHENGDTMLFTSAGSTGATYYDINITVVEARLNVTHLTFNPGGDMNVTLRYNDLNGTVTESGTLNSNVENVFYVNYTDGGELRVEIGKADGSDGGLLVKAEDVDAYLIFFVALPPPDETKSIGYEYDATMDYVQGDMRVRRGIGK